MMASDNGKSRFAAMLFPPALVVCGVLALWENEGRFDYYQAAKQARVVASSGEGVAADTVALTAELDTSIPVPGQFLQQFPGYLAVSRSAEIYSWDERRQDGKSTWSRGWHSSLESNSRNRSLRQTLRSHRLHPPRYLLGDLEINPTRIHFVDEWVPIGFEGLSLTGGARQQGLRPSGSYLYKGRGGDGAPQLGDERISYRGIPVASPASYFGRILGEEGVGKQFDIDRSFISGLIGNDGVLHLSSAET